MLKLLIFDWDGTLADSVEKIIACKKVLAKKYNLPIPNESVIREVIGTKLEDALATCFPSATLDVIENLAEDFHILMQQSDYQAPLFPYVNEMLSHLKRRGFKLAIATSKDRNELDGAILHHGLSDMFEITCCGKEYQEKPHPAMLEHIMNVFQVNSTECLMIGDTTTDMLFAANAGISAIGVTFGAHSFPKLQTMKPMKLIDNWDQLPEAIDKLC